MIRFGFSGPVVMVLPYEALNVEQRLSEAVAG